MILLLAYLTFSHYKNTTIFLMREKIEKELNYSPVYSHKVSSFIVSNTIS
jgi:hypothetical protein